MPEPITEQGQRVLALWQGSWVAAFAVGLLVWGLIVWSIIFHRKRSEQLPPQVRYNMPIEALYTVLPIVVIAVLFYFTARDQTYLLETDEKADANIEVVAFQWSWEFNYLDQSKAEAAEAAGGDEDADPEILFSEVGTPDQMPTLVLREGDVVHFDLHSPDVIHSFWIPAFAFKLDVVPGHDNEFQVKVNEGTAGTYMGRCAELCGADHTRMLFQVEVMEPDEYDAWYAEQQEAAEAEQAEQAAAEAGAEGGEQQGDAEASTEGEGGQAEGAGTEGADEEAQGQDASDGGEQDAAARDEESEEEEAGR
ncbi:cytochrome c oxidase subunit II [Nocardiopsis sp. LSu2-4]|uniref:cytochrome-c oxidase n=1 Tax=Nocardiopsis suaedae TaxID=3018444 RepID=A0ABT4TQF5_9ACTN|nr:cytochrome c oxidase subunit II [Nocardiopsis suaedae]MDA2806601.1 cytochrome c oxidase subunit II [Nocardiopsis suaedae]